MSARERIQIVRVAVNVTYLCSVVLRAALIGRVVKL